MQNLSEDDKKTVSVNIRKLREQAGFTQKELAEMLYVSDKVVSKWERGESLPDPETLVKIAGIFGVEVGTIMYENENARVQEPSARSRRRLPQNAFTRLCILAVIFSSVALFVLSIKAYIGSPDTIGIHFGADGKTDLYGNKAMLFMCPTVSVLFAAACVAFNFLKMTWRINLMGASVYIDDLFKEEENRNKIYVLLSAGLNATILAAQGLFVLLGMCMALQVSVPVFAMWLIVALAIVVPAIFTVAGFVRAGQLRKNGKD